MGAWMARELNSLAQLDFFTVDQALQIHLESNHYPSVPSSMISPCKLAIQAWDEDDRGRMIPLPEGITWQDQPSAPAEDMIETFHLHAFLGRSGSP